MEEDRKGFLRPTQLAKLSRGAEQVIERVCPGLRIEEPAKETDGEEHHVWGSIAALQYTWARDPATRHIGSSGGALSATLIYLLESRQVDGVVTTAARSDMPIRNATIIADHTVEIQKAAGSRYAPSAPLAEIADLLDGRRALAFVGKPCDVAALRQLARIDPRVDRTFPWMISFFCAGLPSYEGTDALLSAMGIAKPSEVAAFRFRGDGWPGKATVRAKDGRVASLDYDTSWGGILTRFIQFRCKICPDGIGQFADIAFADGWHLNAARRPTFEEADGRSLALARTHRAAVMLQQAVDAGYLASTLADVTDLPFIQPHQAGRKGLVPARLLAMRLTGRRSPSFIGLNLRQNARQLSFETKLRNFLGTLRRLIAPRRRR
ncbi:coenzyme F420-reducing hydrogenase [Aurantiacibacter aquimixticola]|uniref:Coenzyme F420-reducing hydrogenase n=2 Tax=Aurantiacibacter aquimixticola TaxID=1958945 RepID=A0A419RX05_9SPHN|nr:coenzyme F420-reducing hydrogenase [Aurantiacibacter aquimixticola]